MQISNIDVLLEMVGLFADDSIISRLPEENWLLFQKGDNQCFHYKGENLMNNSTEYLPLAEKYSEILNSSIKKIKLDTPTKFIKLPKYFTELKLRYFYRGCDISKSSPKGDYNDLMICLRSGKAFSRLPCKGSKGDK